MGLTIHYTITDTRDVGWKEAERLVKEMRRIALKMKRRGLFGAITPIANHLRTLARKAPEFVHVRHPTLNYEFCEATPLRGWIFVAGVGKDCEPLCIGLCQYPTRVWHLDGERATRLRGWRLKAFSKTQFASIHGWEHFRRCHIAIIDFLTSLRPLGLDVKISDEGHYWPRRSEQRLRGEVGLMNRVIAAAAGAMKDASAEGTVESPIFSHPQFERLEAEGVAERPDVSEAVRSIAGEPP